MPDKPIKRVLIVDDVPAMRDMLRDGFVERAEQYDCPYAFDVDVAGSVIECTEKLRASLLLDGTLSYHVVILDNRLPDLDDGLRIASTLRILELFSRDGPIRIFITGYYSNLQAVVRTMRTYVWDYIIKDPNAYGSPFDQVVVDSAVTRLRQLDFRREQQDRIAGQWLPAHFSEVQRDYGGQLIACWYEPTTPTAVEVIAHGRDVFEVEEQLRSWRMGRESSQQPYFIQIPALRANRRYEG